MPRLKEAFLSLGSNLGERQVNLERALAAMEETGIAITACSSIYETEPQDVTGQPWFLNLVVKVQTQYFPLQLLTALGKIERELGRRRSGSVPRGPRLIDIDILLYGNTELETSKLSLPHPRMTSRRFVLEPLVEIAPELRSPVDGQQYAELLKELRGQIVRKVATAACTAATPVRG